MSAKAERRPPETMPSSSRRDEVESGAESVRSVAKAVDIAYIRFHVPDIAKARAFMEDFGLSTSEARAPGGAGLVYGHAYGDAGGPFIYAAEEGDARFVGVGLDVASRHDLEALAAMEGASPIEPIGAPGDGERVRFIDPNGYEVDAVFGRAASGRASVSPLPAYNMNKETPRVGEAVRVSRGPSRVRRLGHCLLYAGDFRESEAWYKTRFGFLTSDEFFVPGAPDSAGAFMRCDLGDTPSDHHTLALMESEMIGVNHTAFEVDDWDAVMLGHSHLAKAGHRQHWGVGRHFLGSQVFDYWEDPFGNTFEHYTDGDVFDASAPPNKQPIDMVTGVQWGQLHESLRE
ncbi:MAG: VOC family protein [Caulobacterales bacterium]|nr:VOC family protein [Caulobacterales bacterium]